ncbi:type II secretion system GspH family protein [Patescibacteria group bacterium]|nr:type II secretion system GspH family protein [Patescibacteria group bacterium]
MKKNLGFTMIELLIVIAVLGVLAVAVLSAINPIEQINRGKDTGSRSDAEQSLSAVERFYTIRGYYPWQIDASDLTDTIAWAALPAAVVEGDGTLIMNRLSAVGTEEIKASFAERINGAVGTDRLFVWHEEGTENSVYVCFAPKSASFKDEALARCTADCTAGLPSDLATVTGGCAGTLCDADDPMICLP